MYWTKLYVEASTHSLHLAREYYIYYTTKNIYKTSYISISS